MRDRQPRLMRWGFPEGDLSTEEVEGLEAVLAGVFAGADLSARDPRPLDEVSLRESRLDVPDALADICRTDREIRARHTFGRSYTDVVRTFRGEFTDPPDVVALPRDDDEVAAILDWCAEAGAACVPFGGGTSVVGGVNPPAGDRPVVTLQMRAMDRVLDVDPVSRAAHIQAGAAGPVIESQLAEHGYTLHYTPQSWELSTLGGWLATHSAGHFGMRETHVDHLVEQVTAITPSGEWASRRLPASGAGPSPDAFLLGSEGTLGVITSAWMRLTDPPRHRAGLRVEFASIEDGEVALRQIAHAGLDAQHLRLLPPFEAALNDVGDGTTAVLLLGFESAHVPVDDAAEAALDICRDAGGDCPDGIERRSGDEVGAEDDMWERWRHSYLAAPYQRDVLVARGVIVETFETAITWDRLDDLRVGVLEAAQKAVEDVCGTGLVSARISHAYPDGACPYFTVVAPGVWGSEPQQWAEIKAAATEAILAAGGTVTHHHAVGRDHQPWYVQQAPPPFLDALRAAKSELDPAWILNPGVLLDADDGKASS